MKRHHWIMLVVLVGLAVLLFAILMFATAHPASAPTTQQGENIDDATMRVAHDLYCPVCPNTPLDVCDTTACAQWRQLIKEQLTAGKTPEEIQQYFVAQYGERVLGAPRPEGINLAVYAAPVAAIAAGAVILYLAARRWVRGRAARADSPPVSDQDRDRIERDLKELE